MEFENKNPQNGPLCDICGERPGVVQVMFANGSGRRAGLLCERCAREAVVAQQSGAPQGGLFGAQGGQGGQGAGIGAGRRSDTQTQSQTPTLD